VLQEHGSAVILAICAAIVGGGDFVCWIDPDIDAPRLLRFAYFRDAPHSAAIRMCDAVSCVECDVA